MRLVTGLRVCNRWVLDTGLQGLVSVIKRHGSSLVLHISLIHQDVSSSLLKELHLGLSKVEVFSFLSVLHGFEFLNLVSLNVTYLEFGRRLLLVAFILLLDRLLVVSHVFSDEESIFLVGILWIRHGVLMTLVKSHLLVVWRSEHFFVLSLTSQFWREYLRLDVVVRPDV